MEKLEKFKKFIKRSNKGRKSKNFTGGHSVTESFDSRGSQSSLASYATLDESDVNTSSIQKPVLNTDGFHPKSLHESPTSEEQKWDLSERTPLSERPPTLENKGRWDYVNNMTPFERTPPPEEKKEGEPFYDSFSWEQSEGKGPIHPFMEDGVLPSYPPKLWEATSKSSPKWLSPIVKPENQAMIWTAEQYYLKDFTQDPELHQLLTPPESPGKESDILKTVVKLDVLDGIKVPENSSITKDPQESSQAFVEINHHEILSFRVELKEPDLNDRKSTDQAFSIKPLAPSQVLQLRESSSMPIHDHKAEKKDSRSSPIYERDIVIVSSSKSTLRPQKYSISDFTPRSQILIHFAYHYDNLMRTFADRIRKYIDEPIGFSMSSWILYWLTMSSWLKIDQGASLKLESRSGVALSGSYHVLSDIGSYYYKSPILGASNDF
ncbi:hypothetical protein G9A89_005676 [Geosiphon pyriformis]|nr:hypothetical protein G9A89_005676 [Geosiphon pyriformis]